MRFLDLMDISTAGQATSVIVAVNELGTLEDSYIKEQLLSGKYWIRDNQTGAITPKFPMELQNEEAYLNIQNAKADYVVIAPAFDQDGYWNIEKRNPPLFAKRGCQEKTDISCEKILRLDAANVSVVDDFKRMATENGLTPGELLGYLFERL